MNKWNKLFVMIIGFLATGLNGGENAWLIDWLPVWANDSVVVFISTILMAAVPNGRPFWQVTRPSIGAAV